MRLRLEYLFPERESLETLSVLRDLASAHGALGELRGTTETLEDTIDTESILMMLESVQSAALSGTTIDIEELFIARLHPESIEGTDVERAYNSGKAIGYGVNYLRQENTLSQTVLEGINSKLHGGSESLLREFDRLGRNERGEEQILPPATHLPKLVGNLEKFVGTNSEIDPLVRTALLYHYLDTIHPFAHGNGETTRIITTLFMIQEELLREYNLNISYYFNRTKEEYGSLVESVRNTGHWVEWLHYFLSIVIQAAKRTKGILGSINQLSTQQKRTIRRDYKFYHPNLITSLFKYPYINVRSLQDPMDVSRATAARYLDSLAKGGILTKTKRGKENFYGNTALLKFIRESGK